MHERDLASERAAAINEAYDALRNPARRARYDRRQSISGKNTFSRRPLFADPGEAVDALLSLRRKRRLDLLKVGAATAAGWGLLSILFACSSSSDRAKRSD